MPCHWMRQKSIDCDDIHVSFSWFCLKTTNLNEDSDEIEGKISKNEAILTVFSCKAGKEKMQGYCCDLTIILK